MDQPMNLALSAKDYVSEEMVMPGFGSELLNSFLEFKEQGLFSDFNLKVEYEVFYVHRMVLAGCSDYFRAMFSHGMQDSNLSKFELREVTLSGIRPLIDFAYTGKIHLSLTNVSEILAAATFLQITSAIKLCSTFLQSRMTFDNADQLVNLGCNHGLTELRDFQTKMILDNFFIFTETNQFLEIDAKTLAGYLKSDYLKTTTEGRLLKQVLRWFNHSPQKRTKDAFEVFEKIRYTLDGWPTIEYAMGVEPFRTNQQCSDLIEWCREYMRHASRKHLVQSHRTRVRFPRKTLVLVGGIRMQHTFFIDEIDGDINIDPEHGEKTGSGKNHYYHRDLKTWFPLGVVGNTESHSHCPMVEVNDFGIICGGYTHTQDYEEIRQHATSDVTLFTPGGFAMWDLKHMQEDRAQHVTLHTPGFLYVIGGQNDNGPLKSVERLDMTRETWNYVHPLRKPLYDHAGAATGEKIYISGGVEQGRVTDKLICYEPRNDSWEELVPMLASRRSHCMAVLDQALVVCGGKVSMDSTRCLSSVEMYSLEIRQWTHLMPMRMDCCDMSAIVLEDLLLIAGGENSVGDLIDTIQQYDPKKKSWGTFGRLPYPVKSFGCCALTVKETSDGREETDSLAEAFEVENAHLFDDSDASNDLDNYIAAGWQV